MPLCVLDALIPGGNINAYIYLFQVLLWFIFVDLIEQCKHPDLHKHQSGQHCEPLTTAQRTTQHKPRSRQQHEMEKQYAEEEPKKEEEEAEEEEEENVPKKKEPLLLQETIKLQAIKKNQVNIDAEIMRD